MGSSLTINGSVKDGMSNDIVTNIQKNMNSWVGSGSGTVAIAYSDGNNKITYSANNTKKYALTLQTEQGKKYIIVLSAKSPTGFIGASNTISITNGLTKEYITISNVASDNYKEYKKLLTAEDVSVTIELDLSKVQSSNAIELDIKDVSLYVLGVAEGGGGGGEQESVVDDFYIQCVSAYPDTHEGATASRTIHVDNSGGYTYLSFEWKNDGSATGYGWIEGNYTFNGVKTQLYFQQNAQTDVGDTIKINVSGLPSSFDVVFQVNSTTGYQYSTSTSRLNISNMILTNE